MKRIVFLTIAAMLTFSAFSQEENSVERKAAREAERAERQRLSNIQAEAKARLVDSLISKRNFLLTADYLGDSYGNRVVVDSKVNFIIVDSARVIIQTGSMNSMGYNGLGGLTTDGNITRYEVTRIGKDKSSYSITLMVMTSVGMYDILINVSPDGNATATLSGNTGGRLIYYGDLGTVKGSRIYRGNII